MVDSSLSCTVISRHASGLPVRIAVSACQDTALQPFEAVMTVLCFIDQRVPLQVETAEGLTIRVVNNVSQRLDVKSHFAEAFKPEGYPDGFNYQQKVRSATRSWA